MKKMMSVLMVLVLMLSLAGCSSKDKSNKDVAPTKAGEPNEATTVTEGAEVTQAPATGEMYNMVMEIVNYGYDDKDIKLVEDEVNKITEAAIGVHVTFLTVPIANMGTKLELMVAGDEQMDLVQTGLLVTPNNLAAEGVLTPMTDYLSDTLKNLAGDLLNACTVNGEIYAYPGNLYPGLATSLQYDKDLADQYNIQMPEKITSLAELDAIFEQVKASGMTQYATSTGDGVNTEWILGADYDDLGDSAYVSYGVIMGSDTTNTIVNWYETDQYKQQCETKKTWYDKGYSIPDSISNGYTVIDSMTQGTIFSYLDNLGTGSSVAYWSAQTGKNLAAVPISDVKVNASGTVKLSWGIASNCKNPQKVCDFLELMYTNTELANLISYGIKDTHYAVQEGSKIIKYPDGVDPSTVGYGSFIGPMGDSSQIYYREPLTDEFVNSVADYGVAKAKVSKYMGYTFDTTKVQTELAAVNSVITQYAPSLSCGVVDVDKTLTEFRDALKTAGIDKVIAENQTQLNAWLSK